MMAPPIAIEPACPEALIPAAASLFWEAFRQKLVVALEPEAKALRFLASALLARRAEADALVMDGSAVAPEARGTGVGTRLLDAVAVEAARRGLGAVRLGVIDSNPRAAALDRRSRFVTVRRVTMGPLRHFLGFGSAHAMMPPVQPPTTPVPR
jgi:ribosomal protein S18 acetylase RimI-like enzyme